MDVIHSTASSTANQVVHMSKRDFFRLPEHLRQVQDGLKVQATEGGRQVFKPVVLH